MPTPPELPVRRHTEVIREAVPLAGRRVLDVGCGDGALAAWMARQGAVVTGVETDAGALDRARATLGAEHVIEAPGQSLPLPDGCADIVLYFNSFHHVPADAMDKALAEVARVLTPGGDLVVIEPLAEGDYFELLRPIEDETAIRAAAYEALGRAIEPSGRAGPALFQPVAERLYRTFVKQPTADALTLSFRKANPARGPALDRERARLTEAFRRLGEPDPEAGGRRFAQPFRLTHLRRG